MRKITSTILSICTLAVAAFPSLAGLSAPKTAYAETQTERHTALADGYAAVSNATAEGSTLYLFNERNCGVWQEYLHSQTVTEMHFDGAGNLYFLDQSNDLYKLNLNALETNFIAEDTSIDCFTTFCILGDYLYSVDSKNDISFLKKISLSDFTVCAENEFDGFLSKLAVQQDEKLRCLEWGSGTGVYALDLDNLQTSELFQAPAGSDALAFAGDTAFTTTNSGSLCGYDMTTNTPLPEKTGTYTALSSYGDNVYLLSGSTAYSYSATGELLPASGAFARPLVDKIPTEDLQTELSTGAGGFTVVETANNALLIEVTDEGEPYFKHQRSLRKQPLKAIKIAERSGYAVLAYRENPTAAYKTYLVDPNLLTEKTAATITYDAAQVGYITNAAHLYKYPHLGLPTTATLERGEKITLVGEIRGLDCDYYEVTFEEGKGYIPKAYVTLTDGIPPQAETLTEGEKDSNEDGIWRLVYLLLGGAAICILVDFLILRKKRED